MKDFMLLYKGTSPEWRKSSSKEQIAAQMEKWGAWMAKLQKTDQLVAGGSPLEYAGKRMTKGGNVVTDIAAAEMKELVTGYSIVRAKDADEAVAIAKECPIFRMDDAVVEVREVMKM
jgi:hypothetical protein